MDTTATATIDAQVTRQQYVWGTRWMALVFGGLVMVLLAVHPWASSVSVCTSGNGGCTPTSTLKSGDLFMTSLEVNTGWFSHGSEAVARLYDSSGSQVAVCNLNLGDGGDGQYDFQGCFKPLYTGSIYSTLSDALVDGETYSVEVYYGSILGGEQGKLGQTTFTYQKS